MWEIVPLPSITTVFSWVYYYRFSVNKDIICIASGFESLLWEIRYYNSTVFLELGNLTFPFYGFCLCVNCNFSHKNFNSLFLFYISSVSKVRCTEIFVSALFVCVFVLCASSICVFSYFWALFFYGMLEDLAFAKHLGFFPSRVPIIWRFDFFHYIPHTQYFLLMHSVNKSICLSPEPNFI